MRRLPSVEVDRKNKHICSAIVRLTRSRWLSVLNDLLFDLSLSSSFDSVSAPSRTDDVSWLDVVRALKPGGDRSNRPVIGPIPTSDPPMPLPHTISKLPSEFQTLIFPSFAAVTRYSGPSTKRI